MHRWAQGQFQYYFKERGQLLVRKDPGKAFGAAVRAKAEITPNLFKDMPELVISDMVTTG